MPPARLGCTPFTYRTEIVRNVLNKRGQRSTECLRRFRDSERPRLVRLSSPGRTAAAGSHPPCRQAASRHAHDEQGSMVPEFVVGMSLFGVTATAFTANLDGVGNRLHDSLLP